jgi:flavin reductase (DIM6/NTAB) family NADH-FMN oxidoreductase RutF
VDPTASDTACPCRHGDVTSTILIGEVVMIHVLEAITTRTGHGHVIVDLDKYAPVSRMGGDSYARVTEYYDIKRPGKEWQERSAAVTTA